MIDLKAFRKSNHLRQDDVADYLNVTRGYISMVENGLSKLSEDKLLSLLANTNGWDTSALTGSTITARASGNSSASVHIGSGESMPALLKEIELLREQLAEEKQRSAQYWEMIQKLMK